MKDLFLCFAFFFTSCTRWGLLFPLLANVYPSSSLIWSGFESLHLLNARLWDFIFFPYFSDLFACRAFWTHYFLSFLSRIPLYQLSLSVLPLTYLGPILPLFHFVVVHWSIVNHAARLLWFTLFTIVSSLKGTVET